MEGGKITAAVDKGIAVNQVSKHTYTAVHTKTQYEER